MIHGTVVFQTKAKAIGRLIYSTNAPFKNLESSITIIGTDGAVKVTGQYLESLEFLETRQPFSVHNSKLDQPAHYYLIDNVINHLLHNDQIATNAFEGMKVVDVIEKIYQYGKVK